MFKIIFQFSIFILCFFLFSAQVWAGFDDAVFFDARKKVQLNSLEFFQQVSSHELVIMGEKHYTDTVQKFEGSVITNILQGSPIEWTLGWEFLAYTQSELTNLLWSRVLNCQISVSDFLLQSQNNFAQAALYSPMFEALKANKGVLIGLNLTREEKAPVTQNGIKAVDPHLLPPNFAEGGPGYFARFTQAMQGHATPEQMQNYFDSQCLTDDVMAYQLLQNKVGKAFVVAGSFHTDYFDGMVARIQKRNPTQDLVLVRIVDQTDYDPAQWMDLLQDPQYGPIADFVVFVK